tara:strand:+ start:76 stop:984 length:909 start_codon:yes stop_codon:yes gene_type:complete
MAESERMRGNRSPVTNYKVGDGSVKDLFRYIMGDELPVKKFGRNKKGTVVKKGDMNVRNTITNGVRGSVEATAPNPFGATKTQFVETDPPPPIKRQGVRAPIDEVTIEGPPARRNIEYGPYKDMEFYRTGTSDSAEGLRGIQKSSPTNGGGMGMAPPVEEDGRNYIGEFGKGFGNVGQQENNSVPSVAEKIINAIYNFGGLLNAPSTKQIVMAIGPENISAEENAEIDEVKYYLDRYPEIMELAKQLNRPPSQQEVIAIIKEYESKGKIKPKKPYLMKAYGGKVKRKKKKKAKKTYGKSYNY